MLQRTTAFRPVRTEICLRCHTGVLYNSIADQAVSDRLGGAPCALPGPSGSEAEASPEGIVFRDDHDLVAVDFIGGDGAEGSIPCLEDDD